MAITIEETYFIGLVEFLRTDLSLKNTELSAQVRTAAMIASKIFKLMLVLRGDDVTEELKKSVWNDESFFRQFDVSHQV